MNFQVRTTPLEGLLVVETRVFGDDRGHFLETWNAKSLRELGLETEFVQDNQSLSRKGTIRGLHFQVKHPQAKLVRVFQGRAFDVAVDLRRGSATFGQWYGTVLDHENHRQLFIPAGFAHGFLALEEGTGFFYKCSDHYHPGDEGGILWCDPDLAIDWPLEEIGDPVVSDKDRAFPPFSRVMESMP